MQPREEITYLGPKASYTHQAALSAFDPDNYKLSAQITIEDVFSSVQSGRAAYGVVPFENSTNGSVVFTLDLFADQQNKHPDIVVCGERYVEVHHCVLGRASASADGHASSSGNSSTLNTLSKTLQNETRSPSSSGHATPIPGNPNPTASHSVPLMSVSHVKKLYSHPQAWGQCKTFLSCYFKGVERQDVSSTSRAAELVAADDSGTTAAISSSIAAEMNGLDFLARDVEDSRDNSTRFFVIRRCRPEDSRTAEDASNNNAAGGGGGGREKPVRDSKSLLSFTISNADPGALADALAVFKAHAINLTSINPRPSGEGPWHYMFLVEFQGRRGQPAVNKALEELDGVVRSWRWLGSWENSLVKER
ncbi:hypothetical protein MBLNU459_g5460t1 [Dothideomycetes sp. NU459]